MERSDHIPDQLDPKQYDFQAEIDCTKTDLLISILQQTECKGDMFPRNYCPLAANKFSLDFVVARCGSQLFVLSARINPWTINMYST